MDSAGKEKNTAFLERAVLRPMMPEDEGIVILDERDDGDSVIVEVGSVEHPMTEEHYIEWVYVEFENGGMRKILKPGDKPTVSFCFGTI